MQTAIEPPVTGSRRWRESMMDNYGVPELTLVRGDGARVWDETGRCYVDLLAGLAVNTLGHAHPAVIGAVTEQITRLGHVSNLYASAPVVELAEQLLELLGVAGRGRVLFGNSGAEANETAFKLARRTGRSRIVATTGGFHGRTMGALALTGQQAKRTPFEPMPPGVVHVPYGDTSAMAAIVDADTAAVVVEPIQGEAGVLVPPPGYLAALRRITASAGALLIVDEVQTGIARTGEWFAHQREGITPDVVTVAKGLGGGLPIGACIAVGPSATLLRPGEHGSTFGGNPVCCAAALAVLRTIREERLIPRVLGLGYRLTEGIRSLRHPLVAEVRGAGLLLGIRLREPVSAALARAAQRAGFLTNPVQPEVLRLAPPLVVTESELDSFLAALPAILDEARHDRD
ncbi:MAG TPA: acetylornithine transaminase [Pseudonocardiaceae bacterium]|jgi:acetylornithine aminotransferase|nr:acetylornithine transaminase [Pseudonocardiaceae bacterium]